MVDEKDRELDDLKTRILVLNREKAMLLAKDRSTIIREGTRAETGIERKRIERELVISRGLAETDVDAAGDVVEVVAKPRRELREVRASDSETRTRGDVERERIRKAEREREVVARPSGRK